LPTTEFTAELWAKRSISVDEKSEEISAAQNKNRRRIRGREREQNKAIAGSRRQYRGQAISEVSSAKAGERLSRHNQIKNHRLGT